MNTNKIPSHIAIIMDGNGRWAQKKGNIRSLGHRIGTQTVKDIITHCDDLGIKYLTLYAFSTENWKRPKAEINFIMNLLVEYLKKETDELKTKNVKMNFIGDTKILSKNVLHEINNTLEVTKDCSGMVVNVAINYGARSEIVRAVKNINNDILNKKLSIDALNEQIISNYLYTKDIPDPDLVIRTGGEIRISNFLIYQCAYSEFYFTDVLWPDFDLAELKKAIEYYQSKNRRFGDVK